MSRRMLAFVVVTALLASALLATNLPAGLDLRWAHYVAWVVICLVSETMWSAAASGEASWSLAATAGLSAVVLWGPEAGMWIGALSTFIADLFVQRKAWVRALFNSTQIALTSWLAGMAFAWLGGRHALPLGVAGAVLDRTLATTLVIPFAALTLVYFAVNRAMVSLAVSWTTDRTWWRVLRDDWLYVAKLEVDAASFLLVPLMVISFTAVGYPGVLLFYAPLFMLFQSDRRYQELKRAEEQNLLSAAFAAKGEMAAGLGHNLNNIAGGIRGATQLLRDYLAAGKYDRASEKVTTVLEGTEKMRALANWLQDYKRTEFKFEPTNMNALLNSTIEIVKSDKRLRGVDWQLDFEPQLAEVKVEVAQLQDVFINLFVNAGDAMAAQETPRVIMVSTKNDSGTRGVRIVVEDSGPGIGEAHLAKMFTPRFTTKTDGHGFGLSTAKRSIELHGGRMSVESPPGRGAQFTILLPQRGSGASN